MNLDIVIPFETVFLRLYIHTGEIQIAEEPCNTTPIFILPLMWSPVAVKVLRDYARCVFTAWRGIIRYLGLAQFDPDSPYSPTLFPVNLRLS